VTIDNRSAPSQTRLMSADNLDTKPTIETVLQRISELGERLESKIDSRFAELRSDMRTLQARVDEISIDVNKVRGDLRVMNARIVTLEEKAS
jgi:hypothetical protein